MLLVSSLISVAVTYVVLASILFVPAGRVDLPYPDACAHGDCRRCCYPSQSRPCERAKEARSGQSGQTYCAFVSWLVSGALDHRRAGCRALSVVEQCTFASSNRGLSDLRRRIWPGHLVNDRESLLFICCTHTGSDYDWPLSMRSPSGLHRMDTLYAFQWPDVRIMVVDGADDIPRGVDDTAHEH